MTRSRFRSVVANILLYGAIVAGSLMVVDLLCISLGLFPPRPRYGDPDLGWRSGNATGEMSQGRCIEFWTGDTVFYQRNEDGVRTRYGHQELMADSVDIGIGITGDSQTELCAPNGQTHSGVLETELRASGIPVISLTYAAGRYSPLQGYLALKKYVLQYHPRVLVLNVYTGNDFYDMLRADDRPHFETTDSGYRIVPPVWYSLDDPHIRYRSRILFLLRTLSDMTGIRQLFFRFAELRRLGAEQHAGLSEIIAYMRDLWRARETSVGYSDAFIAQMLNQQLFFQHFPGSEVESLQRMAHLMKLIRAENPGVVLVMSPLPSYELVGETPVDSALTRVLGRLSLTYDGGRQMELRLYDGLRRLAEEQGWAFADNLAPLQAYHGSERLYNGFDYHLLPVASALIGRTQAKALAPLLKASSPKRAPGRPSHSSKVP